MPKKSASIKEPEIVEEQPAVAPKAAKKGGYVALAPFSFLGVSYQEGDPFAPPAGCERDASFEEFRNLERRHGETAGLAFSYPIQEGKETFYRRSVLPVKEA